MLEFDAGIRFLGLLYVQWIELLNYIQRIV